MLYVACETHDDDETLFDEKFVERFDVVSVQIFTTSILAPD